MIDESNDAMQETSQPACNGFAKPPSPRKGLIITIVAIIVVFAGAALGYDLLASPARNAKSADADARVHDFSMQDMNGQTIALNSLADRSMVLNFWASTCGPCKKEMPEFQKAYERYGDKIAFVMVNMPGFNGETRERALSFLRQNDYDFPVYFDNDEEGATAYDVDSIPRTYFIDSDGYIALYAMGSIDEQTLLDGIETILE